MPDMLKLLLDRPLNTQLPHHRAEHLAQLDQHIGNHLRAHERRLPPYRRDGIEDHVWGDDVLQVLHLQLQALPLHAPDGVHLFFQGNAGLVQLSPHNRKFPGLKAGPRHGGNVSLAKASDGRSQRVDAPHEPSQQKQVDYHASGKNETGNHPYIELYPSDDTLIFRHGHLARQRPSGYVKRHGEDTPGLILIVFEHAAIALLR